MRKEVAKLIAGVAGIGAVVLTVAIATQLVDRDNALERITQWPDLEVQTLDGDEISTGKLLSGNPVLFNYFSTDCTFCQGEIRDIADHIALQSTATLIFVSDEEARVIKQFRHDYGLDNNPKFLFLVDSMGEMRNYYRIRSVPATYLYDTNGQLIQFFRGQVKTETLYSQITDEDG